MPPTPAPAFGPFGVPTDPALGPNAVPTSPALAPDQTNPAPVLAPEPSDSLAPLPPMYKWLVPIDVLLLKRVSKNLDFTFGGAYGLVKDAPNY